VKERGKNSVQLNGGVSGIAGSFIGFSYATNNFLGLGETLSISSQLGSGDTFHVISGYRSPETNQMLAERSDGVARHSLHMDGKAIDIRIPGRDLTHLRDAALNLRSGGVGFYPGSQFVHVDIGRVRKW